MNLGKLIVVLYLSLLILDTVTIALQPNILWIMSDDLGWGEVEVFPGGSKNGRIRTPNLNQFAAEGMRFMNAYSGYSLCSPSRASFFSGVHSGFFSKYNVLYKNNNSDDYSGGFNQEILTVTEILKDAGYETALVGKADPLKDPVLSGFDTFFGQIYKSECHNRYPRKITYGPAQMRYNLSLNWKEKSRTLCMENPEDYSYTIDLFQNKALEWLDHYHVRSQMRDIAQEEHHPFFLMMSYTIPHSGGWRDDGAREGEPVPTNGIYKKRNWPDIEKDHASAITYMDNYIGQLISKLRQLGIDENTITIFASDNGPHGEAAHDYTFFNSSGGLKGGKNSIYEGGIRTPTLIRWPGHVPAGKVSDFQWAFWDVFPTLADLAGVDKNKLPHYLSGRSILSTLIEKEKPPPPKYLYFTGNLYFDAEDIVCAYAIRSGRWKGVSKNCFGIPQLTDEMELYDLISDPNETEDISKYFPDEVDNLKNILASENGISCECYS